MIRQDSLLGGVQIHNEKHIISLFADDVIIYLKDPVNSFDRLMQTIEKFSCYSGYKLNVTKTQTLIFHTTPTYKTKKAQTEMGSKIT